MIGAGSIRLGKRQRPQLLVVALLQKTPSLGEQGRLGVGQIQGGEAVGGLPAFAGIAGLGLMVQLPEQGGDDFRAGGGPGG